MWSGAGTPVPDTTSARVSARSTRTGSSSTSPSWSRHTGSRACPAPWITAPAIGCQTLSASGVKPGRDRSDLVRQPDPVATVDVPGHPDRAVLRVGRAVDHDHRDAGGEPEERQLAYGRH